MSKCDFCLNRRQCESPLKTTEFHNCSIFSFDFKKAKQQDSLIKSLSKENNDLIGQVFNLQSHYDLLKQSYDNVFDFIAEKNKTNRFLEINNFMEWVPTFKREEQ